MNRKTYVIIAVILVLILVLVIAVTSNKGTDNKNKIENAITNVIRTNQSTNVITNTMTNAIANTITNTVTNTISNEIKNEVGNTEETNKPTATVPPQSETFEESPESAREKAIKIVKENWNGKSNVEFTIEGMDETGRYRVGVRDADTTAALAFYTVNISDGTFTKGR